MLSDDHQIRAERVLFLLLCTSCAIDAVHTTLPYLQHIISQKKKRCCPPTPLHIPAHIQLFCLFFSIFGRIVLHVFLLCGTHWAREQKSKRGKWNPFRRMWRARRTVCTVKKRHPNPWFADACELPAVADHPALNLVRLCSIRKKRTWFDFYFSPEYY